MAALSIVTILAVILVPLALVLVVLLPLLSILGRETANGTVSKSMHGCYGMS